METITSNKNPLIIQTKQIKDKPNGKLFIENPKLVYEAYLAKLSFDYILVLDKKYEEYLHQYSFLKECKYYLVSENVVKFLSDTKTPQGIIAIANFRVKDLVKPKNNFIVLENLQDPGNLGTIIRSARGTSFKDIYLINSVNYCNQKVVRSAMGNLFAVNIYECSSTSEFINFATENKLKLIRADLSGKNLFEIKKPIKYTGVVIGNEGNGLSKEMKDFVKESLTIPMKNGLESLNAGVGCSIIIYYLDNLV